MRVIHCFDRFLNGTMNWAGRLIEAVPDCRVDIASPVYIRNEYFHRDFRYWMSPYQDHDGFEEGRIPLFARLFARFSMHPPHLMPRWIKTGVAWEGVYMAHAHFANVAWAYRVLRLPLIVSFYGYDYGLARRSSLWRRRYRKLFRRAAAVVCEGPYGAEEVVKMGCPREKVHIIELGIHPKEVPFRERQKEAGALRLVQMATFTEKKGHRYALEAFQRALADCPNLELTLVGEPLDKKIYNWVREEIRRAGLQHKVHLADYVPFSELYSFLDGFDAIIQPSCHAANGDCEGGAPVVLIDAQACGLPVLATRHCDIPSVVAHEKTGLLCPEKDSAALAEQIRVLYQLERSKFAAMSRQARIHAEASYDVANSGLKLRRLYQTLSE